MAARVVWLVGTGQVAPEQVLGLTFTNKAAGELPRVPAPPAGTLRKTYCGSTADLLRLYC
ncbi:UvrD-helicase domain-containing protein, partial [Streptomyces microflavus]